MFRALNTVGLTDTEKAVVKATYEDEDDPKVKHVSYLIKFSQENYLLDLAELLVSRVHESKWTVVLKALIVMHRLSRDASDSFMKQFSKHMPKVKLQTYRDQKGGQDVSIFIRNYARYLASKAATFNETKLSVERVEMSDIRKWTSSLSSSSLSSAIHLLGEQLGVLLGCKHSDRHGAPVHKLIKSAMLQLLKDAYKLHSTLTCALLAVLDHIQELDMLQAEKILQVAKNTKTQNEKFSEWSTNLQTIASLNINSLPPLEDIPKTFSQLIKQHIKELSTNDVKKGRPKKFRSIKETDLPEIETLELDFGQELIVNKMETEEVSVSLKKGKEKKKDKKRHKISKSKGADFDFGFQEDPFGEGASLRQNPNKTKTEDDPFQDHQNKGEGKKSAFGFDDDEDPFATSSPFPVPSSASQSILSSASSSKPSVDLLDLFGGGPSTTSTPSSPPQPVVQSQTAIATPTASGSRRADPFEALLAMGNNKHGIQNGPPAHHRSSSMPLGMPHNNAFFFQNSVPPRPQPTPYEQQQQLLGRAASTGNPTPDFTVSNPFFGAAAAQQRAPQHDRTMSNPFFDLL